MWNKVKPSFVCLWVSLFWKKSADAHVYAPCTVWIKFLDEINLKTWLGWFGFRMIKWKKIERTHAQWMRSFYAIVNFWHSRSSCLKNVFCLIKCVKMTQKWLLHQTWLKNIHVCIKLLNKLNLTWLDWFGYTH